MRKQDRKHIISKRFKAEVAKVEPLREYDPTEAFELVKSTSSTKFDPTVDIAVRLGVDPRQGDQVVRGTTELPNGTGKSQKVAVFARGANAEAAEAAGADTVGAEDLIAKIQGGWRDFDVLVATRVQYRVEKGAIVHAPIGKASFPTEQLLENMNVLIGALIKAKPSASKGRYIKKITVSSTMGPGIGVDLARAQATAEKS